MCLPAYRRLPARSCAPLGLRNAGIFASWSKIVDAFFVTTDPSSMLPKEESSTTVCIDV